MKNIKEWATDDRPREKLLEKGKNTLSDAELLAIIIGSGSKTENVVVLSKKILFSVNNNWNELSKLTISDLCKFNGIGKIKAIEIIATLEIGRRKNLQEILIREKINSSKDIYDIFKYIIGDLQIEEFWCVYLNQSNKILKREKISQGGISQTLVDIRLIFKRALELNSTSIIVLHNHPSGNCNPSFGDKEITKEINKAGNILNITLLDHVIITQNNYYSFIENDLI